ncbi:chloroplast sensor kinase, chloroplastic [Malania oleifera]|uniref:chloroplast sensor kinase, chloroplastic n=1 Tax=Malania oleifera TaxID=397392 RepID=UPI0025AE2232|nr:chloroplast sensor kinase, chloroplastic [Malania oleifera]
MLLSAIHSQIPLCNPNSYSSCNLLFCPHPQKLHRPSNSTRTPLLANSSSSSSPSSFANTISEHSQSLQNPNARPLHQVSHTSLDEAEVSSAAAVASAIRSASTSPVDFVQRIEKDGKSAGLVLPSADFQKLCLEQLDLFRRIVVPNALLSVYVRPAGSYVMDRLELRRVALYPGVSADDVVILIGNFSIPTGLRAAEAALSNQQAEVIPEFRAVVFPMVKHPFVVGFLVAELPMVESCSNSQAEGHDLMHCPSPEEAYALPRRSDLKLLENQTLKDDSLKMCKFTAEQRSNAINISRSIAMAYVMDQKAMLLQHSSWQNNVRMSKLVEQIRGPLSSIRTLSKMLSLHVKGSEISFDIVEDILVQGDRIKDTLQQLQDAVYLTKANIVRYNEETLKKMHNSFHAFPESSRSQLSNNFSKGTSGDDMEKYGPRSLTSAAKDLEMPMPPLALAPLHQGSIRPCDVSDVLADLVGAVVPLAHKQQRAIELSELSPSLQVAVEEPALRQALSNLIEGALLRTHVGGRVEIVSTGAPAGGALVVIDDDGPDMHYMTQMHSLTPFGADLFSEDMVEDNMTWNFVAGLTVAREILESYGCVLRVISPRASDAALGAGGTRVELWLPSFAASSDPSGPAHEA